MSITKNINEFHRPEWHWAGRSLSNYKAMHADTARKKDVADAFQKARTLTQARKILFGYKSKNTK